MPPYAELSQERMGVWKRTPIFLRREVMTVVDMKTGFFVEKIGGTIFVVNAMPAEGAKHTQEEIVKAQIQSPFISCFSSRSCCHCAPLSGCKLGESEIFARAREMKRFSIVFSSFFFEKAIALCS